MIRGRKPGSKADEASNLGKLNQAELSWVLQPVLSATPSIITSVDPLRSPVSTLSLHNTLINALYANILRDPPPTDVAPWVVATDKPTAASKNAGASGANDKAEERLKRETMALHARDRRRIKTLKENGTAVNDGFTEIQEYKHELAVKPPDTAPQSAGGLAKTNWDLEIRRKYAQNLASETLEFPTQSDIQNRIEPACYEEGLAGGAQSVVQACAEFIEQATEVYLKELIGHLCAHSLSNGEGCIQTAKHRRQLHKEEEDVERGILQRNAAGLLPAEMEVKAKREPLDLSDLRIAVQMSDSYFRQDPFLRENVMLNQFSELDLDPAQVNGVRAKSLTNGTMHQSDRASAGDTMALDDNDRWKGGSGSERDDLMGFLDDCLAVG